MPTKTIVKTVRNSARDVTGRFYFSDAAASPPNALRVAIDLSVDTAGGGVETVTYDIAVANSTTLSAGQRSALAAALGSLRDEAVSAQGFI